GLLLRAQDSRGRRPNRRPAVHRRAPAVLPSRQRGRRAEPGHSSRLHHAPAAERGGADARRGRAGADPAVGGTRNPGGPPVGLGSGPACDLRLNTTLTDEERRRYQDPAVIRRLLATARIVAIVGMSADPQKASAFVASYLQHEGYRVIPVNPRGGRVLGETIYPDL